jgi:WD40 repeat protein
MIITLEDGLILTSSEDCFIKIWNESLESLYSFGAHKSTVLGFVKLRNGNILSFSYDHSMLIWERKKLKASDNTV